MGEDELILRPVIIRALRWDIEHHVWSFNYVDPVPLGCSAQCLFVAVCVRPEVVKWGTIHN